MSGNDGKYVLQRKLAEGGMAELFLARQHGLEGFEKLVVVKRILPQLSADESFVAMFLNEARVAARLNHPNVVQIFDLGKLGEQYFIAMEYVHGEDLRTLIREAGETRRPSLGLCCRIVADALAGLHYAHTRTGADGPLGIVHRDVSPQNVIVTYEGSIKIVDFGIAKATREVGAAQTQAGLLKGKYSYMSPEQARGAPIDARADVFCAGILLWELATWTRLFKRPTEMATLMAVIEEPIHAPRSIDPTLPPELDALIVKALARDPNDRFASAQQMRAALETLIRTQGWEADSLALAHYVGELFADKLKAQAADIAAAGVASLEDFLLNLEEKTSISWMELPEPDKKTPSSGLPMTPPFGHRMIDEGPTPRQPTELFDDGPTSKATDEELAEVRAASRRDMNAQKAVPRVGAPNAAQPPSRPSSPQPPVRAPSIVESRSPSGAQPVTRAPQPPTYASGQVSSRLPSGPQPAARPASGQQFAVPESQLATVRASTSPHNETAASAAPPLPPGTITSSPEQITMRPSLPPVSGPNDTFGPDSPLVSSPDALTQAAMISSPTAPLPAEATRISPEQPATPPKPTGWGATRATARNEAWIPPSKWRRVLVAGSVAIAVGAITLTVALWPSPDAPPSLSGAATATLVIDLDAPADIRVDGKPQPRGQNATVTVQPGVEHEVTVQATGHPARSLHVPALAPGEHMPLHFTVN